MSNSPSCPAPLQKLSIKNAGATIKELDEADADFLHIDTIRPGYILRFWPKGEVLSKLEIEITPAEKVEYVREKNGTFRAEELNFKGDWQKSISLGTIEGNFYTSATADGMFKSNELKIIADAFKGRINFSRDFQAGDKFKVIYESYMVDDKPTGDTRILAVIFQLK